MLLACVFMSLGHSFAQLGLGTNLQYIGMVPMGDFGERYNMQHGLGVEISGSLNNSSLNVGLGMSMFTLSALRDEVFFSADGAAPSQHTFAANQNLQQIYLHAHYLLPPLSTPLRPFVGIRGGMTFNAMGESVRNPDPRNDRERNLYSENIFSSRAFSAGLSAGMEWDVSSLIKSLSKNTWFLNVEGEYNYVATIDYASELSVNPPSILPAPPQGSTWAVTDYMSFQAHRHPLHFAAVRVGFRMRLWKPQSPAIDDLSDPLQEQPWPEN